MSEALNFASTNPQYDDRLFIELQVQYMKIPSSNLGRTCCIQKLFLTFRTIFVHIIQHVLPMFCKKKSFWQRFTFIENFLNIDDLNKHIELDHQTQSVINCEKCQNSYCSTNLLDMHYLEVHSEKRYTCSLCSKSQSSSFKLKSHIDSIHKGIKQVVSKR